MIYNSTNINKTNSYLLHLIIEKKIKKKKPRHTEEKPDPSLEQKQSSNSFVMKIFHPFLSYRHILAAKKKCINDYHFWFHSHLESGKWGLF